MKSKLFAASILLAGISVAGPASAQPDPSQDPLAGTVNLDVGFEPDPHVIRVQAGGAEPASSVGRECQGFVSVSPDVRLVYQAGDLPLIISADSNADTTLVVNAPDGRWYCDDDGGRSGINPSIRFNNPLSGAYEVWVGTFEEGDTKPARLHISEVESR
jgi:hypothetical protein